jgi:hypothetical protein
MAGFINDLRDQIENRTISKPARWAEKRRIMGLPFEGNYSFKYHPWCRELHNTQARWNVSMKSAQAGFTEVGMNLALYTVDVLKKNVLYVLPTFGDACDFSRSRFNPALRMSPYLKKVFTDANNVGLKMAGNVSLYIRGSRGDANLKSLPVAVLILDELDEMDQSQIELALHRLRGQPDKKVWFISTPTVPGHGVSLEYEKSTQEHFRFKCPGCGKIDEFIFPDSIQICGESMNDPDCYKSYYQCTMCKYQYKTWIDENNIYKQDDKLQALYNTGFWHPTVKGTDPDRRGFKINQLYSYTVAPYEIVIDYFKAQTNEFSRQEFSKSVLGEPYIGEKSQVTEEMVRRAVKPYACKQLTPEPGQKRMITMGLDRGEWCHFVVCEWFYSGFTTDLNAIAECRVLDVGRFHQEDIETYPDRLMYEWGVSACVVDMDPGPQDARRFARRLPGRVWLSKYIVGRSGKEMVIDDDGSYAPIVKCDRTNWFDVCLDRFFKCTIELPNDLPLAFTEHITNLVRVYEKDQDGHPYAKYKNFGKPDHFGHALNYAEMALPCAASRITSTNIGKFL